MGLRGRPEEQVLGGWKADRWVWREVWVRMVWTQSRQEVELQVAVRVSLGQQEVRQGVALVQREMRITR